MALKTITIGSNTTWQGAQWYPDATDLSNADLATLGAGIYEDGGFGAPVGIQNGRGNLIKTVLQGAIDRNGLLFLPGGRSLGANKVAPGDWVAIDGFGNVMVIPQRALPKTLTAAGTTTTGQKTITFTSSVLLLGWQVGTVINGTGVPTNSIITSISKNGLTITINIAATATATNTMTAGTFSHT